MNKYYPTKKFIKSKSIWAVYKGEEEIAFGTFDEIEKKLNLKRTTMFYYVSDVYKRRLSKAKRKDKNICFVLVEKVKGEPLDFKKYNRMEWKNGRS